MTDECTCSHCGALLAAPRLYYFAHPHGAFRTADAYPGYKEWDNRATAANAALALVRTSRLLRLGVQVFSPVAHAHALATTRGPGPQSDRWTALDNLIIERTEFAGIILAPEWEASAGCRAEQALFEERGLQVLHYNHVVSQIEIGTCARKGGGDD